MARWHSINPYFITPTRLGVSFEWLAGNDFLIVIVSLLGIILLKLVKLGERDFEETSRVCCVVLIGGVAHLKSDEK